MAGPSCAIRFRRGCLRGKGKEMGCRSADGFEVEIGRDRLRMAAFDVALPLVVWLI